MLVVSLTPTEFECHTERFQIPCLTTSTNVVLLHLVLTTNYKLQKKKLVLLLVNCDVISAIPFDLFQSSTA